MRRADSPPLPRGETRMLVSHTIRAIKLAESGCVGEGYTGLLEGFWRVRRLESRGEPSGPELVRLYRKVLDDFAGRYNMARD